MVTKEKIMSKTLSLGCSYSLEVGERYDAPGASIHFLLEQVKYYKSYKINKDWLWIMDITQVGRISKQVPIELHKECIDKADISGPKYQFQEKLGTNYFTLFTEQVEFDESWSNEFREWWLKEEALHYAKSIEEHIEDYLITLKKIQEELVGYDYKMFLMNNTFEGYFYEDGILKHIYSESKEYNVPDLKNTIKLKDLYPKLWKDIDLSKFTFYSIDGNQYGGLDEYTIDNFESHCFIDTISKDDIPFGKHPNSEVHISFFNKVIHNRL